MAVARTLCPFNKRTRLTRQCLAMRMSALAIATARFEAADARSTPVTSYEVKRKRRDVGGSGCMLICRDETICMYYYGKGSMALCGESGMTPKGRRTWRWTPHLPTTV